MKRLIKELIPPLMIKFIKRALNPRNSKIRFPTFEKASIACRKDAYQNIDLVGVVVQKNIAYKEKLKINPTFDLDGLRILTAIGISLKENTLNVIDFGGGAGYHFTLAKAAFSSDLQMRWHVVETEVMTKEAQRLASDELKFFDTIDAAKNGLSKIDLVFSSSALQYCSDPLSSLRQLTELNASHLYMVIPPPLNLT
jgi:putative methyltransferase (TIGR04325 family)